MCQQYQPYYSKRFLCWDEQNRLVSFADCHNAGFYQYDASGERTYKLTGGYTTQNIQGHWWSYNLLDNPTLYYSPYLVATPKGYTKHYYAESERIASRIGGGGLADIAQAVVNIGTLLNEVLLAEEWLLWDEDVIPNYYGDKQNASREQLTDVMMCASTDPLVEENRFVELRTYWHDNEDPEPDCYWYHTDHLGSSSWITYSDGSAVQHLHYLPWGEDFVDQRTTSWNAMFTFSAKERDAETGFSYFGSRYYSSDLSIWLSVDPMSGKYPSLSPYVYCADNPVKLVDPNGEDFETEIDYDNKTITIKATYYTANCNKELLQKGVDMWNNQSGMYSYVMGEGDNAVSCTIKFELLIAEGNFETDADAFKAMPMGQSSNFVSLIDNVLDDNENEVRGKCDGKIAYISNNQSLSGFNQPRTIAHELGHTLGCGDMSVRGDLMESGGFGSSISTNDIRSIMYMAGYDNLGAIRVSQGKSCDKPQSGDFTGYVRKN